MPNDGKTVTVDRLLRRSTLQDHITIDELPMPEGSQKVELIKLRNSFTEFATEEEKQRAMEQAASPKAKRSTGSGGHDIHVTLPYADVVELQPNASGWFAVLLIDKAAKEAIESFVHTGRRHFKETNMHGGYVSPFSEPLAGEVGHARVHVKISEMGGRLLHTNFFDEKGAVLYKPGDEMLDVHHRPLLGACAVTIHMAGYWYDKTKQGPLLYLMWASALDKKKKTRVDEAEIQIDELLKSPGGTVTRRSFTRVMNDESTSHRAAETAATGPLRSIAGSTDHLFELELEPQPASILKIKTEERTRFHEAAEVPRAEAPKFIRRKWAQPA